jgi:hypothetical protein
MSASRVDSFLSNSLDSSTMYSNFTYLSAQSETVSKEAPPPCKNVNLT